MTDRSWRVSTAVRVFVIALATGRALSSGLLGDVVATLSILALIGTLASLIELRLPERPQRWTPIVESVLIATVLMTSRSAIDPMLVCLAMPALVAGIRNGWVTALNTSLAAAASLTIAVGTLPQGPSSADVRSAWFWLVAGLGLGLLAGWQTRSIRALEERQSPYAEAYQLVAQLHEMTTSGAVGLDTGELAAEMDVALRAASGATATAVFARSREGGLVELAAFGGGRCLAGHLETGGAQSPPEVAVLTMAGAEGMAGTVVLMREGGWTPQRRQQAQSIADEFALRLETAILFDELRHLAMAEERNRIAREMHDGVAQELVALGYVVDEITSTSGERETRTLASSLRDEITRLVTEIRFSIFDLRHHVSERRLAGALSDYIYALGDQTNLQVHLSLDESGPALPGRVASEVMRVAQEAIGNARKHARAANLWVTLVAEGSAILLQIEDDGIGNAVPRDDHWGLLTMHERATGIAANLTIEPRQPRGTTVRLESRRLTEGRVL